MEQLETLRIMLSVAQWLVKKLGTLSLRKHIDSCRSTAAAPMDRQFFKITSEWLCMCVYLAVSRFDLEIIVGNAGSVLVLSLVNVACGFVKLDPGMRPK